LLYEIEQLNSELFTSQVSDFKNMQVFIPLSSMGEAGMPLVAGLYCMGSENTQSTH